MKAIRERFNPAYIDLFFRFVVIFVLGVVSIKYYQQGSADPLKCQTLLNDGYWLDPGISTDSSPLMYRNWQPAGCMMHKYTKEEIQQCFAGERLVFAGDSTSRQVFEATLKKMGSSMQKASAQMGKAFKKQSNMKLVSGTATISFIWDPYLNSARLHQELEDFRYNSSTSDGGNSASLLFLRAPGLWLSRGGRETGFQRYKDAIQRIAQHVDPRAMEGMGTGQDFNEILLSPALLPFRGALSEEKLNLIQSTRLIEMNEYLQEVSSEKTLPLIWSYNSMLEGNNSQGVHDRGGLHLVSQVAEAQADIILNLRCNTKLAGNKYYDRSCCVEYAGPNVLQTIILSCMVLATFLIIFRSLRSRLTSDPVSMEGLKATFTILFVVCLCFLADHTHLFEKRQKHFPAKLFTASFVMPVLLGLLSLQKSSHDSSTTVLDGPTGSAFLPRQQVDELRGLTQVLILLCDYAGTTESLEVFKVNLLLTSCYVFLVCYSFTAELLQGDLSFGQAIKEILRLNLLAIPLSYTINTNYPFYYFPAMLSFWMLIIFIVLRVAPEQNRKIAFVILKMLFFGMGTTAFVKIPGVMESFQMALGFLFQVHWDVTDLRLRLSMDLYIPYVGMIVAIIKHQKDLTEESGIPQLPHLSFQHERFSWLYSPILFCTAVLSCACYTWIAVTLPTRGSYTSIHAYLSWVAVLGFVILRNSCETLRSYNSTVLSWLGQISPELYVLKYHLWLAGESKGLLSMGIVNPMLESVLLMALLLWISWHTSEAAQYSTQQIFGSSADSETDQPPEQEGYALIPTHRSSTDASDEKEEDARSSKPNRPWKISGPVGHLLKGWRWRLLLLAAILWATNLLSHA